MKERKNGWHKRQERKTMKTTKEGKKEGRKEGRKSLIEVAVRYDEVE